MTPGHWPRTWAPKPNSYAATMTAGRMPAPGPLTLPGFIVKSLTSKLNVSTEAFDGRPTWNLIIATAAFGRPRRRPRRSRTRLRGNSHGIVLTRRDMDIPMDNGRHKLRHGRPDSPGPGGSTATSLHHVKLRSTSPLRNPKDKKSGDKFDVDTGQGMVQIKIR